MEQEQIYIVLYRHKALPQNPWRASTNGIFTDRRLADNYAECQSVSEPDYVYGIVAGPISNPAQMKQAEAELVALGEF